MDKKTGVMHLITTEEFDPFEARLTYCLNYCIERAEHDESGVYFNLSCILDQALIEYNYKYYPPERK